MKGAITFSALLAGLVASLFGAPLVQEPILGSQPAINTFAGGTGTTSPSGILYGDETIRLKTVTIGSNLTFSGGTLSATGGASSTLLADSNTFSGNNTFSNTITGAITGNAGSATVLQTSRNINGVAFNGSANITITAASSTLLSDNNTFSNTITGSITGNAGTATALAANGANCSAGNYPLGVDASGAVEDCTAAGGSSFAYPFPSNATTTQIAFNGGLTAVGATTTALAVTGSTTISSVLNVGGQLNANGGLSTSELTVVTGAEIAGLVLTDVTGSTQCLQVNSSGNVSGSGAACGSSFSYPFPSNATTTLLDFQGGLKSASTTLTGPFIFANATGTNATTTSFFATTASSTNLYGANLAACQSGSFLTWASGLFGCDTDDDTTYTAGDALTLTGNDIDFDGGATPAGDLGGTWASPSVTDDSHAHTGATISGLDISGDTNLTAGDGLTLTDDDLDCDTASASIFGCLASADWTLFDNKVSSTSIDTSSELAAFISGETGSGALVFGTAPTISNATLSSTTLTGNFVFANATGTNATTTSLNVSGQVDFDQYTSALLLTGAGGILAEYGGASACTNQFVTALSAVGATTCASINNDQWSGTDLSVANGGTGASTLTGLLQGNGTSAITAITGTAGQFPYYNGTNTLLATSSIFLDTTGLMGVGSTTPWGIFSIEQSNHSAPAFVVANQGSTTPTFIIGGVDKNGNIGIGTSSPFASLSIGLGNGSSTKAVLVTEHRPATTTSITIDAQMGNQQNVRLGTSATTITLSNITDGQKLIVITCNPRSAAGAITWASSPAGLIQWAGGTAPTQTTTANKCDIYSFLGTMGTTTLKYFGAQSASF